MTPFTLLPFVAALFAIGLAFASLFRKRRSPAGWCFFAGMTAFGLDTLFTGFASRAVEPGEVVSWLTRGLALRSCESAVWLAFSVTYSRGDYRQFLIRWKGPLLLFGLFPLVVLISGPGQLLRVIWSDAGDGVASLRFGAVAKAVNGVLLISLVLTLVNLEQTFRAAVGTMRWRIKFVILGLGLIFGTRIYVQSQALLYSAPDPALAGLEAGALIIGCVFLVIAYLRAGWAETEVYPSQAVLRSSLTVIVVGGYLFIVGVLAQIVSRFGGAETFQFQALVVLLGMAGLAVLLLSDNFRQRIQGLAARHFRKAQHDSVRAWTLFSRGSAAVRNQEDLCEVCVRLISETFGVLSVSVWMLEEERGQLTLRASTAGPRFDGGQATSPDAATGAVATGLATRALPFDLEEVNENWAEELRGLTTGAFASGGSRLCVPLRVGEQNLGAFVLADRVGAAPYSVEELELLACIGDHAASVAMNLQLAQEVLRAKELEAFRTMSAFFVHDLKNAAASLNLMLKNLPVHFDDPAFRADALRAVGNTAKRIDDMIVRLSAVRQRADVTPVVSDLNELVIEAIRRVNSPSSVEMKEELHPLPQLRVDREQIQSVVTNLVLNAQEAVGAGGRIQVRTRLQDGHVILSVADNGCGMTSKFVEESLFRPFQSTKKKGLGIGLFQSRTIVQAHGGRVQVESEPGKGTTFHVSLPVRNAQ